LLFGSGREHFDLEHAVAVRRRKEEEEEKEKEKENEAGQLA
jgi:hypothetical protein